MGRNTSSLQNAIREFDSYKRTSEYEQHDADLEWMRFEFVRAYPPEKIRTLCLEDYVVGRGRESHTFCYRMEYELKEWGSISGNATSRKYWVWYSTKNGDYQFVAKHGANAEKVFERVKEEIAQVVEAGQRGDSQTILKSPLGNLVKGKILALYYPHRYLPVFSISDMKYFLSVLTQKPVSGNWFDLQEKLLYYKQHSHDMKKWTNRTMMVFLYRYLNPEKRKDADREEELRGLRYNPSSKKNNGDRSTPIDTVPVPRKAPIVSREGVVFPRDPQAARNAIAAANYTCQYDSSHKSFTRRSDGHPYMEAHHLIPMSEQYRFENSLDVPENIISLCSECHNRIHYGIKSESDQMVQFFYKKRINTLMQGELNISLNELKELY